MDSSEPLISLRDLQKTYKMGDARVHALKNINLQLMAGDFVAVMGSSGSGKSTLMNIVGLLDRPTSGQYLLQGTQVVGLGRDALARIRGQTIGFVFQGFNLLPRTSAQENVELPLLYQNVSAQDRHARARQALVRVQLGERLTHTPNQLSGGQQQRVAIARALITNPHLLLADEPTGNLDSQTSIDVMRIFQELNAQGLTILLVTHETEIAEHARRIITFKDGAIVSDVRSQKPSREHTP